MKLAVIGTGYWGKNHVRALNEILQKGEIDDLVVCDADESRARTIAKDYGLDYCVDYRKLLKEDVDGTVIATPSNTHYKLAREFMQNGKDVLVEKPMTLSSSESDSLVKLAETEDKILMAGHIFRYHCAVNEIRKRIARGDFGEIFYISSNRYSLRYPRGDMGVLFALGIHEVDIFCYLIGTDYPDSIFASIEKHLGPVEEVAQIIAYFDRGARGYATESWLYPSGKKRELLVVGSKQSAYVDYLKPNELTIFDLMMSPEGIANEGSYIIPIEYREPLKEELKDFIACIKTREKPVADMHIGKRAVEIIEKAFQSAINNERVKCNI